MPMFHVEHMKRTTFPLLFAIFFIVGCTKADPDAYKRDPILLDFQTQVGALQGQVETITKEVDSTKKELKTIVPQTGQADQYAKKINDLQGKIAILQQQIQFFKIHIESRAKKAQADYLESLKNKKEWPDKVEVESYMAEKRLRTAKMNWSQKDRITDYKKTSAPKHESGAEGSHEPPAGGH
jgi:uncharacterized phage infection (PIP) family protein YhgE